MLAIQRELYWCTCLGRVVVSYVWGRGRCCVKAKCGLVEELLRDVGLDIKGAMHLSLVWEEG